MSGFHWGLNQPTAINDDPQKALDLAVANVGERYVTPERSAEDIARALCVSGTPEDCTLAIQERIDAGVRDFNFSFLSSDADGLYQQMEMFAKKVIPQFRT